jgi:hypothetical protein
MVHFSRRSREEPPMPTVAGAPVPGPGLVDVHQHLWPPALIDALRARTAAPRLTPDGTDGWTLHLPGEPPYAVRAADHDVTARQALEAGTSLALVSLSSPLGIEDLAPDDAAPLLAAWHEGAARLPAPFGAWAAVTRLEPDLAELKDRLAAGFAGLQVPATWLATPAALERLAPVLEVCERADRPVLVHPGAVTPGDRRDGTDPRGRTDPRDRADLPGWWAAVVDYPTQLQAAWWAWHAAGRTLLPGLRIGFVAGAGLAPVHHERLQARGGSPGTVDADVFVETSSYGPQAVDALVRALGIDGIVLGSDRPYALPGDVRPTMGTAAARAIENTNPRRYLEGGSP